MRVVAIAPKYNTPGKKDATGAFQPEARRFLEYHKSIITEPFFFSNITSNKNMRKQVFDYLDAQHDLDGVAFFCHGSRRAIQCGFSINTLKQLAYAIIDACGGEYHVSLFTGLNGSTPIVPLYACDAGRDIDANRIDDLEQFGGDGGFADELRDELCKIGARFCRVDAHTTAGHTDKNPNVRRFEGNGSSTGGSGGYYIVPKTSKLWKKWRTALKTDFRFRFPFMTSAEIQDYLIKR